MKKLFLDNLPRGGNKYISNNGINWDDSIGYMVNGIYDDIEFKVKILDYNSKKHEILIRYNNNDFNIKTSNFIYAKMGKILKVRTNEYKIEIGTRLQDEKRDITITDRKIKKDKSGQLIKYYKYQCNLCGFDGGFHWSIKDKEYKNEFWIRESNLLNQKIGCACCGLSPSIVVKDINSIYKTNSWMIPYVGEECAKTHTYGSIDKIEIVCPDCGQVKLCKISDIYRYNSIGCSCSDNIPYGEKIMFSVLEQLGLDFQTQLSKTTFKWCNKYRYDFYFNLNGEQYICEVNGIQHYRDAWNELKETQENDKLKKELALKNGIKEENYIIIDCRYSTLEWIKNNILKDKTLNILFNLSKINWIKCNKYACTNLVKIACDYKNNNSEMTTTDIGEIMGGYSRTTIRKWLKQGSGIWCDYDANKEAIKVREYNLRKSIRTCSKIIVMFKDEDYINIYNSLSELANENNWTNISNISNVCHGKRKTYKGYTFKYIKDLTTEEYIKYDIENKLKELHKNELVQAC